jgi:large subunit ribosomal protein L3
VTIEMAAIIGRKLGMSQVFTDDGSAVPVTVIEAGPCKVTAVRRSERDGYDAVQLAFEEVPEGKLTKGELGHLKKAGVEPMRTLVEFRDEAGEAAPGGDPGPAEDRPDSAGDRSEAEESAGVKVGDEVTVTDFEPGQLVKVSGVSIGKGFQGTIRRHGFSRGPETHGSRNQRKPGSIGASADPARVFKGVRMPGRMGGGRVTQRHLEVVEVDPERNLLLVKGAVPGSRNTTVEVRSDA